MLDLYKMHESPYRFRCDEHSDVEIAVYNVSDLADATRKACDLLQTVLEHGAATITVTYDNGAQVVSRTQEAGTTPAAGTETETMDGSQQ